jgi:hypothetical protein
MHAEVKICGRAGIGICSLSPSPFRNGLMGN